MTRNARQWRRPRLALERLEDRLAPSTFTVTSTSPSGRVPGSLAWAVAQVNAGTSGPATLDFRAGAFATSQTLRLNSPVTLTGQLDVAGTLSLRAPALTLAGSVRAAAIDLSSTGLLQVLPGATVAARQGSSGGRIQVHAGTLFQFGTLTADGGGAGGSVQEVFTDHYIDTTAARTSANGGGGKVVLDGGGTGSLFSSGRFSATGARGGRIDLLWRSVTLIGTTLDASGSVLVWSRQQTTFDGSIRAPGGSIEVSSAGTLTDAGSADAGPGGSLRLDPKALVIDSSKGVFPRFSLIDPNATAGGGFGSATVPLPGGNVVVTAPGDTVAGKVKAGAAYLYNGRTGALISVLTGTAPKDQVGLFVTALKNGNYVVQSEEWGGNRGAATFGNARTGISGTVSPTNSLLGSSAGDFVGVSVTALSNGNYVVASPGWNGTLGAATWGSGTAGVHGTVSSGNSLVGSLANDQVGTVVPLTNGNYVVNSPMWDGGLGAATWGRGTGGIVGAVSAANSLVGAASSDNVGSGGVTALSNGNYVVSSPNWNNLKGAATWGNGATGTTGQVLATNSLVGSTDNGNQVGDQVGSSGITALSDGNYVVASPHWTDPQNDIAFVGAATWGNGTTGITGVISALNSLVGSNSNDDVASRGVTALTNGNYVVQSPNWTNPSGMLAMAGAATWSEGSRGLTGPVSAGNSLVGTHANDQVSNGAPANFLTGNSGGVTPLPTGNYVVASPAWNNNEGAATFANGKTGLTGTITLANSLLGSTGGDISTGDGVGASVIALANGNYVVVSPGWNNAAVSPRTVHAGAVTLGNGSTGITGAVSPSNSLIGSSANDLVGAGGIIPLSNGNFVVLSSLWNNGTATLAGAATWVNGTTGLRGPVTAANSLVGTVANEEVGFGSLFGQVELSDDNYLILTAAFRSGGLTNAGAVTLGDGKTGQTLDGKHTIDLQNSLVGTVAHVGLFPVADPANGTFLVTIPGAGSGQVLVALDNPNQLTASRGQGQTITIAPVFLQHTLAAGTAVDVQASSSLTVNSPIVVSAHGHGGALTLQAASLTLNAGISSDGGKLTFGGTVSPGGSKTALVHLSARTVAFKPHSSYTIQLNGTKPGTGYDQLVVSGPMDLRNATLHLSSKGHFARGQTFVLVQDNKPITTTFAGLREGSLVSAGGQKLKISYKNDRVSLTLQ